MKIATETHLEEAGVAKSRKKTYLCLHVCKHIFKKFWEGTSVFIVHAIIIHFETVLAQFILELLLC